MNDDTKLPAPSSREAPPPAPPPGDLDALLDELEEAAGTFCPEMDSRCMKRNAEAQRAARAAVVEHVARLSGEVAKFR